jgi:hypothetical protein
VHPPRWIGVLLAAALLLQPLACCKRIDAVSAGATCSSKEGDMLYVTLNDGTQYELVNWEIGSEWVEGERKLVHVTLADDGTATEEEYLEPARYKLSEVADLDVEKVDCRSFWVVGAIAGGVVAGLAAMAALGGDDNGDSGSSGGGIGSK